VINSLEFSSDGSSLIGGCSSGEIFIWDTTKGSTPDVFAGHEGAISSLALSKNSDILVTTGDDKKVKIWNYRNRKLINEIKNNKHIFLAVDISPDSKYTVFVDTGGNIVVYDNILS